MLYEYEIRISFIGKNKRIGRWLLGIVHKLSDTRMWKG